MIFTRDLIYLIEGVLNNFEDKSYFKILRDYCEEYGYEQYKWIDYYLEGYFHDLTRPEFFTGYSYTNISPRYYRLMLCILLERFKVKYVPDISKYTLVNMYLYCHKDIKYENRKRHKSLLNISNIN